MTDESRDRSRRAVLGTFGAAAATAGLGTTAATTGRGGGWNADPLLVSGGEAHVDGEYLYQGWVHDDYGAATPEETGTESPAETTLDELEGDLVYPTDEERYRHNAADIVEVRARPTREGLAYRTALNTMVPATRTPPSPSASTPAATIPGLTGGAASATSAHPSTRSS